jgi:hypothetical protein
MISDVAELKNYGSCFFFFLNSKTNFIKPQHLPQEGTGRAKQIQDKEGLRR